MTKSVPNSLHRDNAGNSATANAIRAVAKSEPSAQALVSAPRRAWLNWSETARPLHPHCGYLSCLEEAVEARGPVIALLPQASATGGKWYAATVIKLRDRLEA